MKETKSTRWNIGKIRETKKLRGKCIGLNNHGNHGNHGKIKGQPKAKKA